MAKKCRDLKKVLDGYRKERESLEEALAPGNSSLPRSKKGRCMERLKDLVEHLIPAVEQAISAGRNYVVVNRDAEQPPPAFAVQTSFVPSTHGVFPE